MSGASASNIFCLCRKPAGKRFMIGCDGCAEWFHGSCVGVSEAQAQVLPSKWFCPLCIKQANQAKDIERLIQDIQRLKQQHHELAKVVDDMRNEREQEKHEVARLKEETLMATEAEGTVAAQHQEMVARLKEENRMATELASDWQAKCQKAEGMVAAKHQEMEEMIARFEEKNRKATELASDWQAKCQKAEGMVAAKHQEMLEMVARLKEENRTASQVSSEWQKKAVAWQTKNEQATIVINELKKKSKIGEKEKERGNKAQTQGESTLLKTVKQSKKASGASSNSNFSTFMDACDQRDLDDFKEPSQKIRKTQ